MSEEWKQIKEYENLYEISNTGKIRSIDKIVNVSNQYGAKAKRVIKGRMLKQTFNGQYYVVGLYKNNQMKQHFIHRLEAQTFIENKNNFTCINHKNGNKLDNRIENLEWCTKSYNTIDAWKNGLIKIPKGNKNKMYGKFGKKANASKSVYQYDKNMNFIKKWNCQKDIERELGYKQSCISNCIIGNSKSSHGYIWRLKYED